MNYIVFDMEWNQPRTKEEMIKEPIRLCGEVIQIGAVKADENGNVLDTLEIMIHPVYYTKMHAKVRKLTGIDNEAIKEGIPFNEAYERFMNFCGDDFCFMTWGNDDIGIILSNMKIHGISTDDFPVCYNLQRIYGKQIAKTKNQVSLEDAIEALEEPSYLAHNALNDAVSAARVLKHLDIEREKLELSKQKQSAASAEGKKRRPRRRRRRGADKKKAIEPAASVGAGE